MDTKLRLIVNFDNHRPKFSVENPPTIPQTGEVISFKWEDFIADESIVKELYEEEQDSVFICQVFMRKFTSKEVTVSITIYEEGEYNRYFRNNKSITKQ